ncbi:MAG TPA: CoA pyrophosphatase [Candidatus Thermoplasmatota archaeon]|jgi:8-oxo-dGTP pyrophosphatase MutT (NUDIX family)|nr:CoA pyrophosphatase [Candidatus Thermoplasmatota archaeon]
MDPAWRARVERALAAPEPRRSSLPEGASAVLLLLLPKPEGLHALFTLRHQALARHAGQWSFPGGRIEAMDKGPADAALRETEEEVGIPARDVAVLGHLSDYTTYYGRLVCAYVGEALPRAPAPRIASADEVEDLRVLPVEAFLDAARYEGRCLPGPAVRGEDRVVHYWHFPGATIWGITAELLARFLSRAYDWQPPRAPVEVPSAEAFRDLARRGL